MVAGTSSVPPTYGDTMANVTELARVNVITENGFLDPMNDGWNSSGGFLRGTPTGVVSEIAMANTSNYPTSKIFDRSVLPIGDRIDHEQNEDSFTLVSLLYNHFNLTNKCQQYPSYHKSERELPAKSSRVVKELVNELSKNRAQNTVIEDEGLTDIGKTTKGRAILEQKLIYTRKITTLPTHKVPEEPDGQFLVLWLKANHTGLFLKDFSKYNRSIDDLEGGGSGSTTTTIKVNNNKHLCLVDAGGLDLGYIGKKDGVNSITAWDLNGTDESAQITNVVDNIEVKG